MADCYQKFKHFKLVGNIGKLAALHSKDKYCWGIKFWRIAYELPSLPKYFLMPNFRAIRYINLYLYKVSNISRNICNVIKIKV